jgi:hypothetical protein
MWVVCLDVRAASIDSGGVNWYLIVVAVIVAGCERLKLPEPIHELEHRMDSRSDEVAARKAGSGSASKPGERGSAQRVMWNMMRRAVSDSKAHLDELARHDPHDGELQPPGDGKGR